MDFFLEQKSFLPLSFLLACGRKQYFVQERLIDLQGVRERCAVRGHCPCQQDFGENLMAFRGVKSETCDEFLPGKTKRVRAIHKEAGNGIAVFRKTRLKRWQIRPPSGETVPGGDREGTEFRRRNNPDPSRFSFDFGGKLTIKIPGDSTTRRQDSTSTTFCCRCGSKICRVRRLQYLPGDFDRGKGGGVFETGSQKEVAERRSDVGILKSPPGIDRGGYIVVGREQGGSNA